MKGLFTSFPFFRVPCAVFRKNQMGSQEEKNTLILFCYLKRNIYALRVLEEYAKRKKT